MAEEANTPNNPMPENNTAPLNNMEVVPSPGPVKKTHVAVAVMLMMAVGAGAYYHNTPKKLPPPQIEIIKPETPWITPSDQKLKVDDPAPVTPAPTPPVVDPTPPVPPVIVNPNPEPPAPVPPPVVDPVPVPVPPPVVNPPRPKPKPFCDLDRELHKLFHQFFMILEELFD